jgi:hypothetical protein
MTCTPAKYDICILQNTTYQTGLTLTDSTGSFIDITSWSFSGSIREQQGLVSPLICNFTITIIDPVSASLSVVLPPESSSLLVKPTYFYDIIATNILPIPDQIYRIIQGKISVNAAVTPL